MSKEDTDERDHLYLKAFLCIISIHPAAIDSIIEHLELSEVLMDRVF
jgi:hypothetical protein